MINSFTSKIFYNSFSTLPLFEDNNAMYITDENTAPLLKNSINYSSSIPLIVLPSGEEHKNIATIEKILMYAINNKLDRNCTFVGFGGGVITDMVGFASSIYMRGVSSILVPTTLLAMIDASIGGKTAVDFSNYKNMIGSFHVPSAIYICENNLNSLPRQQYFSGLGELLKIALINRPELYKKIKDNIPLFLSQHIPVKIIKEAIEGKLDIVNQDIYENGVRAFLNFGHTFAHALEAVLSFKGIMHGEAVVWGIGKALQLGKIIGKTNIEYADEVLLLIEKLGYKVEAINQKLFSILKESSKKETIANLLLEKMKMDKKNKAGKIRLVLQKDLGKCFLYEAIEEELKEVLSL